DRNVTGVQTCALPIFPQMPSPQIGLVRLRIKGRHAIQSTLRTNRELDLDFPCDGPRHLGLQRQNVMQAALVALRPQMSRIADAEDRKSVVEGKRGRGG